MGNCVPSNIDPHSLVESPKQIRRQSKLSCPTHESSTTGEGESSSSLLDILIKNSNRLSKIHLTSRIFLRPRSHESGKPILPKSSSDAELKSRTSGATAKTTVEMTPDGSQKDGFEIFDCPSCLMQKSFQIPKLETDSSSKPIKVHQSTTPKSIPKNNSFNRRPRTPGSLYRGASSLSGKSPDDSGLESCSGCTLKESRFYLRDQCKCDRTRVTVSRTDINECSHIPTGVTTDHLMYQSTNIPPIPPKSLGIEVQTKKPRLESNQWGSRNKIPATILSSNFYEEWNPDMGKPKLSPDLSDHGDTKQISPTRTDLNYDQLFKSRTHNRPVIAVVRHSFVKRWVHQLSVSQKERVIVLNRQPLAKYDLDLSWDPIDLNREWWLVQKIEVKSRSYHSRRSHRGFIPATNLEIEEYLPLDHEAWMEVERLEADRLLLQMGNPVGTYILRPSSDLTNTFALSVRCFDHNTNNWLVKHYRVKYQLYEGLYHVFRRSTFLNMDQLISHHTKHADGLACRLHKPYSKNYEPPSTLIQLEVNRSSFSFIKRLGRGSFGEVWQAMWNKRVPVAIKKLLGNGNMEASRFLEEALLMQKLNHPRIVRLLAVCTKPSNEPAYIVTELMEFGSLKNYMQHLDVEVIKFRDMIVMMRDIVTWTERLDNYLDVSGNIVQYGYAKVVEGMAYLEEQHFIHRDLRASNVLVDSRYQLKVADFGLAHILGDADEYIGNMQTKFPIRWTAPEGMVKHAYTTKSDVWSFGVLAYEILTFCEIPYKGLSSREVKEQVCSGYRLSRPKLRISTVEASKPCQTDDYEIPKTADQEMYMCPTGLYSKMMECWSFDPDDRPTFKSLLSYFEQMLKSMDKEFNTEI